jgi:dolichol-phosphate mannosyltransferase
MRIWVVLPAYNESENLPGLLAEFRRVEAEASTLHLHFIVVDDGSSDHTADIARQAGKHQRVEVLVNARNRGLAFTFMRGMLHAVEQAADDDLIICMDADNTQPPGLILRMVQRVLEGRDVVIASRYQPGAYVRGVPWHRRALSSGMSLLFRMVYPIPSVRDYSCGYRAYSASCLKHAVAQRGDRLFSQEGFSCMVALALRLHKEGAVFGEVPMILRYDRKVGDSKMKVANTVLRTLKTLVKERLSRS